MGRARDPPAPTKYHGECKCEATNAARKQPCGLPAYWSYRGGVYCGTHCRLGTLRVALPKNPRRADNIVRAIEKHNYSVEEMRVANRSRHVVGEIDVAPCFMYKPLPTRDGWLSVFPNHRHQNAKEGFGCAALSPKSMGPIPYFCDALPTATSLENFHQCSKIYARDRMPDGSVDIEPTRAGFLDAAPRRHKYTKADNATYWKSMFFDDRGVQRFFSYLECRFFYCKWYEIFAKRNEDFRSLLVLHETGTNLLIVGYDGYSPVGKTLYDCYLDESKPFGHELVLYCLILLTDSREYPWNRFQREHPELYKDFTFAVPMTHPLATSTARES